MFDDAEIAAAIITNPPLAPVNTITRCLPEPSLGILRFAGQETGATGGSSCAAAALLPPGVGVGVGRWGWRCWPVPIVLVAYLLRFVSPHKQEPGARAWPIAQPSVAGDKLER